MMHCLLETDSRSINKSACNLYRCGHVQKIEVCYGFKKDKVFFCADCLSEMRKDRVYKIGLRLDSTSYEIDAAECGCPAGRGPGTNCNALQHCALPWKSLVGWNSFQVFIPALTHCRLGTNLGHESFNQYQWRACVHVCTRLCLQN